MTWKALRSVVEELDVEVTVDLLAAKHARFSEAWEGIKWLLARTPDLKGAVHRKNAALNYRAFVFAGDPFAETPNIWVVYHFTDNEVFILGVNVSDRVDDFE